MLGNYVGQALSDKIDWHQGQSMEGITGTQALGTGCSDSSPELMQCDSNWSYGGQDRASPSSYSVVVGQSVTSECRANSLVRNNATKECRAMRAASACDGNVHERSPPAFVSLHRENFGGSKHTLTG